MITLPDELKGLPIIASVSGGKDSTALILALREAEIPARYVFADTNWEAPETYDYLDTLRSKLGITIDVVGVDGGMVREIRRQRRFPARMQRWCTRVLKIKPLRAYHDAIGDDTVSALGIRADESESRSKMPIVEDSAEWGGWVWRPLLRWTVADVLAIHHRHGIPVNPLYLRGHDRVGCYPCIHARKDEIRLTALHAPERIEEIAALEAEIATARREELDKDDQPTFFRTIASTADPIGIRDVVEWSRTERGGKQLSLLAPVPTGGCMRWGMCEAPTDKGDK